MDLFEQARCINCGGTLEERNGKYVCVYCKSVYEIDSVERERERMQNMFDDAKREMISNCRKNLYDAVSARYISRESVSAACVELKKYLPNDFAANFYLAASSRDDKQLAKEIRSIDVDANYDVIETVIQFLISSLTREFLLELNVLVERAYAVRDPKKFEHYSTLISEEARRVDSGTYETKLGRKVFVAYSSKDMDKVMELVSVLEAQGLSCFVAARNLRHGRGAVEQYNEALREAMDHCSCFVYVSSPNSRSFDCDAWRLELPYIQQKDFDNAPAEYRNDYRAIPTKYKKPRVEYRIAESRGFNAADGNVRDFFDGYEWARSPEEVASRVVNCLLAAQNQSHDEPANNNVTSNKRNVIKETVVTGGGTPETLIKRVFMFLEDGDWATADEYCEKVLDIDPENAQAYLGKLMAELKVKKQEKLMDCAQPFDGSGNYKKALRFADDALKNALAGYIAHINTRNEYARIEGIYNQATEAMKSAKREAEYRKAADIFKSISGYKDADTLVTKCILNAESTRKDAILNTAKYKMSMENLASCEEALKLFESVRGWKDADERSAFCRQKIEDLKAQAEAARVERVRQVEQERKAREERKKKIKKISIIAIPSLCVVIAFFILLNSVIIPAVNYNSAIELMEVGKYDEAITAFKELKGYKDSSNKIKECRYNKAIILMNAGKYDEAINAFKPIYTYNDSADKITECEILILEGKYNDAVALMDEGKYNDAISAFTELNGYKDSSDKIIECNIKNAKDAKVGDYIKFGSYEQDDNRNNGKEDIEWLVLDIKDGRMLVISKYALDSKKYNTETVHVTWETCSLRRWLNDDFLNYAFSELEKAMIPTVTVDAASTNEVETQDRLFLLSEIEVDTYFKDAQSKQCNPTDYAVANGVSKNSQNGNCFWWLRNTNNNLSGFLVDSSGTIDERIVSIRVPVRPAMWIDINP